MHGAQQTLLEQMQITDWEIADRMALFGIEAGDIHRLADARGLIEQDVDRIVDRFYEHQTGVPEMALVIGDADTLRRLRVAQRRYILDLFSGFYDAEYVNNRLRIGLVHKRIGVEPKLYLAAVQTLQNLIVDSLKPHRDAVGLGAFQVALAKLLMFDVALVFDTYIRSMVAQIEIAKARSDDYARALEEKVRERTRQLEVLSRTDSMTGLLNVRYLNEVLTQALRAAQRRLETVTLVYLDVDDFKAINDTQGHQRGDEILRLIGETMLACSRAEDHCFRYGGDEFCVVMSRCTEAHARELYGQRLREAIAQREEGLSLSIGFAQTGPEDFLSPEELLRLADDRMYAEKKAAKARRAAATTD